MTWGIVILLVDSLIILLYDLSEKAIKEYDFAEILKKSICLEQSTQAWCENCEKYQPTVSYSSYISSTLQVLYIIINHWPEST